MSDFIDNTTKREEMILNLAIANRQRFVGISAERCVECYDEIPLLRQQAVQGVKLCVECAE